MFINGSSTLALIIIQQYSNIQCEKSHCHFIVFNLRFGNTSMMLISKLYLLNSVKSFFTLFLDILPIQNCLPHSCY